MGKSKKKKAFEIMGKSKKKKTFLDIYFLEFLLILMILKSTYHHHTVLQS